MLGSRLPLFLMLGCAAGCGSAGGAESAWQGSLDTLPTGTVVVTNPAQGMWDDAGAWWVTEDLRIGSVEGDGPDLFGDVTDLAVDGDGRIYVLEGQTQELRVFDAAGNHVRTVGRKGGGPGEFARAVKVDLGPDGHLWVTDPQNNRISFFDTSGTLVGSERMPGGFIIIPWPGRMDAAGHLYSPVPRRADGEFEIGLVEYDRAMQPLDTLLPPKDPVERPRFELRRGQSFMIASVPFTPSLEWRLDHRGHLWGMLTGEYKLFQLGREGDTLRTITRAYDPHPVTDRDIERALDNMEWFVQQGGKVDRSRIPGTKPATREFFVDDEGNLWVIVMEADEADRNRVIDLFDPIGRYLGQIRLPFPISTAPTPVFRGGMVYAVTEDELEVEYVIRARIDRP